MTMHSLLPNQHSAIYYSTSNVSFAPLGFSSKSCSSGQQPSQWMDTIPVKVNNPGLQTSLYLGLSATI